MARTKPVRDFNRLANISRAIDDSREMIPDELPIASEQPLTNSDVNTIDKAEVALRPPLVANDEAKITGDKHPSEVRNSSETLSGGRAATANLAGYQVIEIDVNCIDLGYNARDVRAEEDSEEWERFLSSISDIGLLQPLVVKPQDASNGSRWRLIAGNRRFLAVKTLQWEKVPALIVTPSGSDEVTMMMVENLHRKNLTILEEGRGVQALMDLGLTLREIHQRLPRSISYLSTITRVARIPELAKVSEELSLPTGITFALLMLYDQDNQLIIPNSLQKTLKWIQVHHPTRDQVKEYCRQVVENIAQPKRRVRQTYAMRIRDEILTTLPNHLEVMSDSELASLEQALRATAEQIASQRQILKGNK